jgi:hypothetical protein
MGLEELLDELRNAGATVTPPAPGEGLAALFRDGVTPSPSPVPVRTPTLRRPVLRVAVAAAVAGFGLGGLGVAGALPDPVQRHLAGVVEHVGVHLPTPTPSPLPAPIPTTTVAPAASGGRNPTTVPDVHPNDGDKTVDGTDERGGTTDAKNLARNPDGEGGDGGTGDGRGRGIGGSGAGHPDDQRQSSEDSRGRVHHDDEHVDDQHD